MKIKDLVKMIGLVLLIPYAVLSLVACGGGGSGSDSAVGGQAQASVQNNAQSEPTATPSPMVVSTPIPSVTSTPESTPTPLATPFTSYEPDADRLESGAGTFSDLYAEPDFSFSLERQVDLSFSVADPNYGAMSDQLIRLYAVPEDTVSWDELVDEDKELIFVGKTDADGLIESVMDIAPTVKKVLAVVSAVGIDNKTILDASGERITHHFGG